MVWIVIGKCCGFSMIKFIINMSNSLEKLILNMGYVCFFLVVFCCLVLFDFVLILLKVVF